MKKIIVLAGAITITAACTEDVSPPFEADSIGKPIVVLGSAKEIDVTTVSATPAGNTIKVEVSKITHTDAGSAALNVSVAAQWAADRDVSDDKKTSVQKSKITASISADSSAFEDIDDAGKTLTLTIPAGQNTAKFYVRAVTTQLLKSGQEAQLKVTLTSSNGYPQVGRNTASITIKGSSPLAAAPSASMLEGRTTSDTLWQSINKTFYAVPLTFNDYKIELKVQKSGGAATEFADGGETAKAAIDSTTHVGGKGSRLGIKVTPPTGDEAWLANDTISIRVIAPKSADVETGYDDTVTTKFVVGVDNFKAATITHKFSDVGALFALAPQPVKAAAKENGEIKGSPVAGGEVAEKKKTQVVLQLVLQQSNEYKLKFVGSDSCTIAVLDADANAWADANRNAAMHKQYGSPSGDEAVITQDAIAVGTYKYLAVKINAWKQVIDKEKDGKVTESHKENTNYYGYLRLRVWDKPNTENAEMAFDYVEMVFKYGEERKDIVLP